MCQTELLQIEKNDLIVIKKKGIGEFIFTELALYISQIFIFFVVAVLSSNMLKDESALVAYMGTKINNNSLQEVGYIIAATIFALGVFSLLARAVEGIAWLESISDEVLNEAPRAVYFFGSSVTGALVAAAIFVHNHPSPGSVGVIHWISMSGIFGLGGFVYGCGLHWFCRRKKYIKK